MCPFHSNNIFNWHISHIYFHFRQCAISKSSSRLKRPKNMKNICTFVVVRTQTWYVQIFLLSCLKQFFQKDKQWSPTITFSCSYHSGTAQIWFFTFTPGCPVFITFYLFLLGLHTDYHVNVPVLAKSLIFNRCPLAKWICHSKNSMRRSSLILIGPACFTILHIQWL